jgi:hypothetical protein
MLALGVRERFVDEWIVAQDRQVVAVGQRVDARRREPPPQRFEERGGADQIADIVAADDEEACSGVRGYQLRNRHLPAGDYAAE